MVAVVYRMRRLADAQKKGPRPSQIWKAAAKVQVIGRWRRSSRCENDEGPAPLGEHRLVTPANAKNLVPPPECETNDLNRIV
ncbi:hypothetical protein Mal52_10140 [Symmachiella dynata]|uniref:Uncharacterized protein n=1 Tax=Symmachiella dynata TaxID=2527995 RepID=A0A517ZJ93_9PLAN|nr:hypothetical protein Mal52_10140 [Symmachiella dynata]